MKQRTGRIKFKPYLGPSIYGDSVVYSCTEFDAESLAQMLAKPSHLTPISFQTAHQIWADTATDLLLNSEVREAIRVCNLGFVNYMEELGYRIVPKLDEIEIL